MNGKRPTVSYEFEIGIEKGCLKALWNQLLTLLDAFWKVLGAFWSHLGVSWGLLESPCERVGAIFVRLQDDVLE